MHCKEDAEIGHLGHPTINIQHHSRNANCRDPMTKGLRISVESGVREGAGIVMEMLKYGTYTEQHTNNIAARKIHDGERNGVRRQGEEGGRVANSRL